MVIVILILQMIVYKIVLVSGVELHPMMIVACVMEEMQLKIVLEFVVEHYLMVHFN